MCICENEYVCVCVLVSVYRYVHVLAGTHSCVCMPKDNFHYHSSGAICLVFGDRVSHQPGKSNVGCIGWPGSPGTPCFAP